MKRIVILLVPLVLLFSVASAENWQKFAQDTQERVYFIDGEQLALIKENLDHPDKVIAEQTEKNPKRVWIKLALAKPDEKNQNLAYQVFLLEFNFANSTQRVVYIGSYYDKDTLLIDKIWPTEEWQPIPEGNHLLASVGKITQEYLARK